MHHPSRSSSLAAITGLIGIVALLAASAPGVALAAAPDVREVSPAGISIDGSVADWDDPTADYLAPMYTAGDRG